jgi:DNA invertase Pin-like site-specific DNA recombinase
MSIAQDLLQALTGPLKQESQVGEQPRKRAFAWARVSTGKQEERGLSLPEQLRQIRHYAEKHGYEIVAEFQEAASAFRHQERRHEFKRMLERIQPERISAVIVHDYSRFGRDSHAAKTTRLDLEKRHVRVISVTDPVIDRETVAGVYMEAITYAKNEAYSREVAFHTRKGCTANVQTRDPETGWCYKNGGQPLFGYRAERLQRGEVKRGRPLVKSIWVPDETVVAGRTMHEWARYCLVELAGKGASLDDLVVFCNKTGISGRRKQFWGVSTWYALLQPSVLMQYCGFGVWNVRDKRGRERPASEWVIVEKAHPALITEAEAQQVAETRKANGNKRLAAGSSRARQSQYLLSGGLFRCERCGANMTGYHTGSGYYYICGSQPYRKGMGCGQGVYVPQKQVEAEVLGGLRVVLDMCADPKGFTAKVNQELRHLWEESSGFRPDAVPRLAAIDQKIANIRQAVEDGLGDGKWANARLVELVREREEIGAGAAATSAPPQIDVDTVMKYRRQTEKVFHQGDPGECKRLLRNWVQEVKLKPETLEVSISYRLLESVMNGLVAGACNVPNALLLPYRVELAHVPA